MAKDDKRAPDETAAPRPDTTASEPPIHALAAWLHTHVHDSAVSRETAIYNRVHALVEEIKSELHKILHA